MLRISLTFWILDLKPITCVTQCKLKIFPRIIPSVGLPILYLNHCIKWPVTSSQAVPRFCPLVSYFMQHPTLQNVRIRSTRDALQVFHGVATHRLPLITRRLDAEERRNIVPGNVYVWSVITSTDMDWILEILILWTVREERGANTEPTGLGMERWCAKCFIIEDFSNLIALLSGPMGWDGALVVCIFMNIFLEFVVLNHQWVSSCRRPRRASIASLLILSQNEILTKQ